MTCLLWKIENFKCSWFSQMEESWLQDRFVETLRRLDIIFVSNMLPELILIFITRLGLDHVISIKQKWGNSYFKKILFIYLIKKNILYLSAWLVSSSMSSLSSPLHMTTPSGEDKMNTSSETISSAVTWRNSFIDNYKQTWTLTWTVLVSLLPVTHWTLKSFTGLSSTSSVWLIFLNPDPLPPLRMMSSPPNILMKCLGSCPWTTLIYIIGKGSFIIN